VNLLPPERNREAMDDDELIAAMAGGDGTALRELFARHAPWLTLAAATVTRSANAGVAAGLAAWAITVLSVYSASGQVTTAGASSVLALPYLAVAAACGAIAWFATRIPKGTS
jgi:hypothetical protein